MGLQNTGFTENSLLLSLPPDFWQHLSFYLTIHDFKRLVYVGSKKLIENMKKGACYLFSDLVQDPKVSASHTIMEWPNIRYMNVQCRTKFDYAAAPIFSSSLTFLALHYGIQAEAFLSLPRGLKSLEFYYGTRLTNVAYADLPPSLTSLKIHFDRLVDTSVQFLPRTLLHLSLVHNEVLTNACIGHLPPDLKSLVLPRNHLMTNHGLSLLPKKLTKLNLARVEQWDGHSLFVLPRGLLSLNFNGNSSLTDEDMIHLPPILKSLKLKCNVKLTNDGIKNLPSTLTKFCLGWNRNMTVDCIKDLPRGLKSFFLGTSFVFSPECAKDMPKSLIQLNVSYERGYKLPIGWTEEMLAQIIDSRELYSFRLGIRIVEAGINQSISRMVIASRVPRNLV
jgi:hypothetical protein